ncbi:hypothetical protein HGRIS_000790 [Hohenbuehelia grisea]|uniref:Uncharacterized protein n=1 Tax=Hohenbuehelia grisea TaxID=104357 RepID=A0ABR3IPS5_9AGAR
MKTVHSFLQAVFILFVVLATTTTRAVPIISAYKARQPSPVYASLYQDFNYVTLLQTISQWDVCVNLSAANNKVSSFRVHSNRCFFYLDANCQNTSYNTPNSNSDLRSVGFNDNISSVRCN